MLFLKMNFIRCKFILLDIMGEKLFFFFFMKICFEFRNLKIL